MQDEQLADMQTLTDKNMELEARISLMLSSKEVLIQTCLFLYTVFLLKDVLCYGILGCVRTYAESAKISFSMFPHLHIF